MASSSASSTRGLRAICLLLVVVGLLAAGYGLVRRIQAERSANAVDVVVDYPEVQNLATTQGVPIGNVLARFKAAGATAVALPEETLLTLEDDGLVTFGDGVLPFLSEPIGVSTVKIPAPRLIINTHDAIVEAQIYDGMRRAYPSTHLQTLNFGVNRILVIPGTQSELEERGLGLSDAKVQQITAAGLRVVPRLTGTAAVTAPVMQASLSAVAEQLPAPAAGQPRAVVIFDGTTIPGYRKLIPTLAETLTKHGLVYGCIEFGKQKGDVNLGAKLKGQLVRVHSISLEELSTMTTPEAIQRFGLAVKDRNIRVLYVRLPQLSSNDPVGEAVGYLSGIKHEITGLNMGFTISDVKGAHPFQPLTLPGGVLALLFAGAGAGIILWLVLVLPTQLPASYVRVGYALIILGVIGAVGAALVMPAPGRIIFGLLAALAFPLLGLTWAYRQVDRLVAAPPVHAMGRAVVALLVTTGITLLGGLLIAAMMAETSFLVKVGQFAGVKVALALPLLIFAGMVVTDGVATAEDTLPSYLARCRTRLRAFLGQPLYLWGAIVGVIALVAVALMLARSGNDAGVGVSTAELKLRALLEQGMISRPRTKEFLIGFPLFLFAMVAAATRRRMLALGLLLAAAIGQVDVLNTYCHAHTPFLLSLLRTANGLWLGVLIGVVLLALVGRRLLRPAPAKIEVMK